MRKIWLLLLLLADAVCWKHEKLPRYLVEFRGLVPSFRMLELRDSIAYVVGSQSLAAELMGKFDVAVLDEVLEGSRVETYPLCGYLSLPNALSAKEVAHRCASVRSIIEVWGDGSSADTVRDQVQSTFASTVRPHFPLPKTDAERDSNSWKIVFRRFGKGGRSGLDPAGKRSFLSKFNSILQNLGGDVNLTSPAHELVFLEDWSRFHAAATEDSEAALLYTPERSFFGKIVGFGREVQTDYSLNRRPFLGTTSMAPLPAHLCAVSALVGSGSLVLDPFCGTGSILVSCAALGASVVGSDIDADCLGLAPEGPDSRPLRERDRGKNFRLNKNRSKASKREGAPVIPSAGFSACTRDNIAFYGLQDRLVGLLARDIRDWLPGGRAGEVDEDAGEQIAGLGLTGPFDAIVTDPPYSRRERAVGSTSNNNIVGNSAIGGSYEGCSDIIRTLCAVACARLKPGGRLVFWYPTDAFVEEADVRRMLEATLPDEARVALALNRLTCEKLHDKLWRWLVVYTRGSIDMLS